MILFDLVGWESRVCRHRKGFVRFFLFAPFGTKLLAGLTLLWNGVPLHDIFNICSRGVPKGGLERYLLFLHSSASSGRFRIGGLRRYRRARIILRIKTNSRLIAAVHAARAN